MARLTMFANVFVALSIVHFTFATEEKCSKYSFEREMMSNMLKMELNVERMEHEIMKRNEDIVKMLEAQKKEMEKFAKDYQNLRDILVTVMENKTAEATSVLEDNKAFVANVLDGKIAVMDNALKNITVKVDNALKDVAKTELTKTTVAFLAHVTQTRFQIPKNKVFVFGTVLTNVGGGYNAESGQFVAPVTGLYLLSFSVLSWNGEEFTATIKVNNIEIVHTNEKGTGSRHGMGSQTIVLELNANDVVTIISHHTRNIHGGKYSTFSGVFLG